MSILKTTEIEDKRTIVITATEANALNDPVRRAIMHIVDNNTRLNKPTDHGLTVAEIVEILHKVGHPQAVMTVRHHIRVLVNAGLLTIIKHAEVKGTVARYYGTGIMLVDEPLKSYPWLADKDIVDETAKVMIPMIGAIIKRLDLDPERVTSGEMVKTISDVFARALPLAFEPEHLNETNI